MVSRLEAGEAEGQHRGGEVVALGAAVGEKGLVNDAADRVHSLILAIGATAAVPIPAGEGLAATDLQWLAEDVEG